MRVYIGPSHQMASTNPGHVKVDKWDWVNAHQTLAAVAVPLLKEFNKSKKSWALVDPEDVPDKNLDGHYRWTYVVDEMIWALEQVQDQEEFTWVDSEWRTEGGITTKEYFGRVDRGLLLFGKYFRDLWS